MVLCDVITVERKTKCLDGWAMDDVNSVRPLYLYVEKSYITVDYYSVIRTPYSVLYYTRVDNVHTGTSTVLPVVV